MKFKDSQAPWVRSRLPFSLTLLAGWLALSPSLWAVEATTPTVKGRAPAAAPTVDNAAPVVGDTVTATSGFSDADGDAEQGTTWRWLLDGSYIAGALNNTYTLVVGDGNGKQLVVEATPATDPASTDPARGTPVSSAPITTRSAVPVATLGAHANPAYRYDLVTSGAYAYSDGDGDAESGSLFDWSLNGASIASGSITAGQTKQTLQLSAADVGKRLVFSVTPKSATGVPNTGAPASVSATVTIPPGKQVEDFLRPDPPVMHSWSEADAFCRGAGRRLPSVTELQELFVSATRSQATLGGAGFIENDEMCRLHDWKLRHQCGGMIDYYWSSTSYGASYYVVNLRTGERYEYDLTAASFDRYASDVACVR